MHTPIPTVWMRKEDHECRVNEADVPFYRAQGFELGRCPETVKTDAAAPAADAVATPVDPAAVVPVAPKAARKPRTKKPAKPA